jgi:hypothetical protein
MADVPRAAGPPRGSQMPLVLASFRNMNWAIIPKGLADNLRTQCSIGETYDLPLEIEAINGLPLKAKKLLKEFYESVDRP